LARGDLAGAEAEYRKILEAGEADADVYYDLGNVLWRQERVAPAILAWRRSAYLAPRDPDVVANLDFARRKVVDRLDARDPFPRLAPWQRALTPGEGIAIGGVLAGAGLLCIALRRRLPGAPLLAIGSVAVAIGAVLAAAGQAEANGGRGGVLLVDAVAHGELGGGVELFRLGAGAEVGLGDAASGRVLVVLPDGRKGWVDAAAVGRVEPSDPFP
jgi:tetratricopeptide (TPR) repeat protein